jgi:hypothetical protein
MGRCGDRAFYWKGPPKDILAFGKQAASWPQKGKGLDFNKS